MSDFFDAIIEADLAAYFGEVIELPAHTSEDEAYAYLREAAELYADDLGPRKARALEVFKQDGDAGEMSLWCAPETVAALCEALDWLRPLGHPTLIRAAQAIRDNDHHALRLLCGGQP